MRVAGIRDGGRVQSEEINDEIFQRRWIHEHFGEPVMLYRELDDAFNEIRNVEVYSDGTTGYADSTEADGDRGLVFEPLRPV